MINIKSIEVSFSENERINRLRKGFSLYAIKDIVHELETSDLEVLRTNHVGIDKTEVIVTWNDGMKYKFRFAIGSGRSLAEYFKCEKLKNTEPQYYQMMATFMENREIPTGF